jgi:hypothetical protein
MTQFRKRLHCDGFGLSRLGPVAGILRAVPSHQPSGDLGAPHALVCCDLCHSACADGTDRTNSSGCQTAEGHGSHSLGLG